MPVATAGEFESEKDPSGMETWLWHVSDLGPSQSRVFGFARSHKAEHFGVDVEWTVLPQTGRVEVAAQQPQLNLSLEGPSEVLWGKPEVYRMRVRNPGKREVKDVEVRLTPRLTVATRPNSETSGRQRANRRSRTHLSTLGGQSRSRGSRRVSPIRSSPNRPSMLRCLRSI